jgi:Ca2+-binding RTX toxin-like protein
MSHSTSKSDPLLQFLLLSSQERGSGSYQNTITGTRRDDTLNGTNFNDKMQGEAGDDVLKGSGGNDKLEGDVGDDILRGGNGDDLLEGGKGRDRLTGDQGSDVFIMHSSDASARLNRTDIITDFEDGTDKLVLEGRISFADIDVVQGTGANAKNAIIEIQATGEFLAVLQNVDAKTIRASDFTCSCSF